MALAPDPFDKEVERLLADPEFQAELEERRALVERGEAVIHDDAEVRRRLSDLGVPLVGPGPTE